MAKPLLTQEQVDSIVRKYKGDRAVEDLLESRSGKDGHFQRFVMNDGLIYHVNTVTGKLTITPPAKREK